MKILTPSFKPIKACTCSDFNTQHKMYRCNDMPYCTEIHTACEGEPLVHQDDFVVIEETVEDA